MSTLHFVAIFAILFASALSHSLGSKSVLLAIKDGKLIYLLDEFSAPNKLLLDLPASIPSSKNWSNPFILNSEFFNSEGCLGFHLSYNFNNSNYRGLKRYCLGEDNVTWPYHTTGVEIIFNEYGFNCLYNDDSQHTLIYGWKYEHHTFGGVDFHWQSYNYVTDTYSSRVDPGGANSNSVNDVWVYNPDLQQLYVAINGPYAFVFGSSWPQRGAGTNYRANLTGNPNYVLDMAYDQYTETIIGVVMNNNQLFLANLIYPNNSTFTFDYFMPLSITGDLKYFQAYFSSVRREYIVVFYSSSSNLSRLDIYNIDRKTLVTSYSNLPGYYFAYEIVLN